MSMKQLALTQSPIVGLQYLSYPLSILLNYQECESWFHSEYIQLTWYKDLKTQFTFANKLFGHNPTIFPYLQCQVFSRTFLSKCLDNIDIHKLIIDAIDDDWYIYSSFDEYFVPHRFQYKNNHFEHDFLLHGYNLNNKEYYIYGYTVKGIIESISISIEQFMEAFLATMNTQDVGYRNLTLLKKVDNFKYEFDKQFFYDSLLEYLNSKNTHESFQKFNRDESEKIYGLELYDYLIKYFDLLAANNVALDIIPLHILWEHKKCMVLRLKYLSQNKILDFDESTISAYEEIEKIAFTTRSLLIKYEFVRNNNILDKIKNNLIRLKASEKEVLENLIS